MKNNPTKFRSTKFCRVIFFLFFLSNNLFSQCSGTLLLNGSFVSAEGEGVTAPNWTAVSTPDINDAIGILNSSAGYNWTGIPIPSSDGGTWQNLFGSESIQQTLSVTSGQQYTIQFEYAAQGISSSTNIYKGPVGVQLFINGVLAHTTPNDSTQYTWETACYTFIATSSTITLGLSASQLQYVGIDKVCLFPSKPVNLGQDTTLCSGSFILDVSTPNTIYLWQDNSTNSTFTVSQPGTYWVTTTNNCFTSSDSLIVSENLDTIIVSVVICDGSAYVYNGISYSYPGSYIHHFAGINGCDSLVSLNLVVNSVSNDSIFVNICPGDIFTFADSTYDSTGVYTRVFQSWGRCDSTITIKLTVLDPILDSLEVTICAGETFLFGGDLRSSEGVYFDTLISMNGCDSVVKLKLWVDSASTVYLYDTICQGTPYSFGGNTITASGIYTDLQQNMNGCDSTTILQLTINPIHLQILQEHVCSGEYYVFGGDTIYNAGVYYDTLQTIHGCDSIFILDLTILSIPNTIFSYSICEGDTIIFGGKNIFSAGTYYDTLTSSQGCDSVLVLNLLLNLIHKDTISDSICAGAFYPFGGINYSNTGIYTHTYASSMGCDSIVILSLFVHAITFDTIQASICQGNSYLFAGANYSSTGLYTHTFQSLNGCDSNVTLNLWVNPPIVHSYSANICFGTNYVFGGSTYTTSGLYSHTFSNTQGCDSVVNLLLTVNPLVTNSISVSICQGSVFVFGGVSYNTTGSYTSTFVSSQGCDSIVTLNLTVNPIISSSFSDTICEGSSYSFGGINYAISGTYAHIFSTALGCDSLVNLHLFVRPTVTNSILVNICDGETYSFVGNTYNSTGIYIHTFSSIYSCDSIVTLHLIVNAPITNTISASICEGSFFSFGGNNYDSTGIYSHVFSSVAGCDSTVTLHLAVNEVFVDTLQIDICSGSSYLFAGINYNTSGFYTHTFTSVNNCDSIVTLNLEVISIISDTIHVTICQGSNYTFGGVIYSASGLYPHVFSSALGCDSLVILSLTVNSSQNNSISESICAGISYTFGGVSYTTSGVYTHIFTSVHGCDSAVTLHLTVYPAIQYTLTYSICEGSAYYFAGIWYDSAGTYVDTFSTLLGCDSIVTLNLNVTPSVTHYMSESICQGSLYSFGGTDYFTSGTYSDTLISSMGCDSIVILNLLVNPVSLSSQNISICEGFWYVFGDSSYNLSGIYERILPNHLGCDSTITLYLTVIPTAIYYINAINCPGTIYTYERNIYTEAGTYTHRYSRSNGCDSLVVLNLLWKDLVVKDSIEYVCEDNFVSNDYSKDNITDSIIYNNNCDTIINLRKIRIDCSKSIYFPNAFSPNDDDVNNFYVPKGTNVDVFELRIFNRWGDEVFYSNDMNICWDGTFKNQPCTMDVYSFRCLYSFKPGSSLMETHGRITLMR